MQVGHHFKSCHTKSSYIYSIYSLGGGGDKRVTGKQATLGYGHKANYTECKYSNNLCLHFQHVYFLHISSEKIIQLFKLKCQTLHSKKEKEKKKKERKTLCMHWGTLQCVTLMTKLMNCTHECTFDQTSHGHFSKRTLYSGVLIRN